MENYLKLGTASLEEMLAACKDYKERQNIRSALRELKGIKLDGNAIITYSSGSKNVKCLSSSVNSQRQDTSAINTDSQENQSFGDVRSRNSDENCHNVLKSQGGKTIKRDENGNSNAQFRSYLYAGTISSPRSSPRIKKESRNPRKVHTAITRIKVLDKSDLVDKCTETEEGVVGTKVHSKIPADETESQNYIKLKATERKERISRYESTPLPKNERKEKEYEEQLDISAIQFSGDLEKVKQTSVLHRPVSVNLSSLKSDNNAKDNAQSPRSCTSPVFTSPRKPRKIVSYRRSAFSPASKLNPVSSTISRARLQSAPATIDNTIEQSGKPDIQEKIGQVCLETHDTSMEVNHIQGLCLEVNSISINASANVKNIRRLSKEVNCLNVDHCLEMKDTQGPHKDVYNRTDDSFSSRTESVNHSVEKSTKAKVQEDIYIAKPIEIKRETETTAASLVSQLQVKIDSKRNRDIKSDLQEFNYFTNKMKEKHGRKSITEDKLVVLSPVKGKATIQLGENEVVNSGTNVISNYTNNKTVSMEETAENVLFKKKGGLSRKTRIDLDEHKNCRKYRKKNKDGDKKLGHNSHVPRIAVVTGSDQKQDLREMSPRKVGKSGLIRRRLPEIPVKQNSDPEDDETVHQRTIRLLQERRKERRGQLAIEKEAIDKHEKLKMTPADLKKTLEQKLEKSDSKRKANRVRRELQLLDLENELKSTSGTKSDTEKDRIPTCVKANNEMNSIVSPKCSVSERKPVQRSKSDIVRRRRAVSETDALIVAPIDDIDGVEAEVNVLTMFEVDEPLTPFGKIELIGNLMQEEAKLQEMLRKSTNFSEKRKMRADVRALRQRRMALEGSSADVRPVTTLRRSASVTAGVVTHATPIYIHPPNSATAKQSDESAKPPSIEELRKQLSETQDYDEKKKIRLTLRQLRQQNREGSQIGLQRSQSFIHKKNSEPVANGIIQLSNRPPVLRSQSVQEIGTEITEVKEKSHKVLANGDVSLTERDKLKHSRKLSSDTKPPFPRTIQHHSSSTTTRQRETENTKTESINCLNNSHETVDQKYSDHVNNGHSSDISVEVEVESKVRLRHDSDRYNQKEKDLDKSHTVSNDKEINQRRTFRRHSYNEGEKLPIQSSSVDSYSADKSKPVELLKATVKKLENQKKNRILEKCEIFERVCKNKSDRTSHRSDRVSDKSDRAGDKSHRTSKFEVKEQEGSSDKTKIKATHILVSRADVERNKQSKLINLRRDRSNSESKIHTTGNSTTTVVEEVKKVFSPKINEQYSVAKNGNKSEVDNKSIKIDSKSDRKYHDDKHDGSEHLHVNISELDSRLSPCLLWLEEKRKSLTPSNDLENLLSTMELEAAFSEILGAVEEFPDHKNGIEIPSADIPILEEESCDSSEVEEDLNKKRKAEINGDKDEKGPKCVDDGTSDTHVISEINNREEKLMENRTESENNCESAIQETSGNNKSSAKIQLNSSLSLDIPSTPGNNGAISVIHGDDGTVTVREVSRVEEGDTTITEWKKLRRTQSRTETRETDTIIEKKITSPGGSSSVYEKDVSKTKHKITSRGSNYFTRNNYNIKRTKDFEGTELVEHDLNSVSENMSVSKKESWGDKSEAKVVLSRDPNDGSPLKLKSIEDIVPVQMSNEEKPDLNKGEQVPAEDGDTIEDTNTLSAIHSHLGRPSGCPEICATLKATSAVEGTTVLLECMVVSSPLPLVTWYRGDNQLTADEDRIAMDFDSESGKAFLEIHPATVKDSGEYKCVFENPLGFASTKGRLIVKKKASGAPSFITELDDVRICEGHSLCMECQVADADTVTWYKDGVIQRNNEDFKQTFDGTRAKLEIVEIFLDDFGTYSCCLKNTNGEKRSFCKVTVKESESVDVVVPVFLKKPETAIANERDPVIIDCEVIGSPRPEVVWYCDGSKVKEDSRHRMSYDGRVAMLVVRRVTVGDSGKMECIAENSFGKVSADCHLVVKALKTPPSVCQALSDLTIISGENAHLECIITGEPKPEMSWRKNGLVIGQMFAFKQTYVDGLAVLEISETCSQDAGCYECLATNEKGDASTSCQLIVKEASVEIEKGVTVEPVQPSITVQEDSVSAEPVKSTVTIQEGNIKAEPALTKLTGQEKSATPEPGKPRLTAQEETVTAESVQHKVTVEEDKVQTGAMKIFPSGFELKQDNEQIQVAKSQASKVMLVRQGSLRSVRQQISDKPLVRSGSLHSIDTSENAGISKKSTDFLKKDSCDNSGNAGETELVSTDMSLQVESMNNLPVETVDMAKKEVDLNKNYWSNLNANIPIPVKVDSEAEVGISAEDSENGTKIVKIGSELSSLCLESTNVKEVKPLARFRASGEIRRSQSVRTPGSQKPEWLQVKLRKVGSKPSPLALEREEKPKTQSEASSNQKTVIQNEIPTSVQNETKLSRSQSASITERNISPGLRDTTNSPFHQPNRDSVKLTPVSERAKIFQMMDANSNSSSSGKASPINIIAKAINLSRTESLRSSAGQRSVGIQRSQSFKTDAPSSSSSQGDVTLELTPHKSQNKEEKSDSGSTRKAVKYWDPTAPSSTKMDYSTITDEEQLNQMLSKSDNFDERKKIRSRIKEVRDQLMKDFEAKCAARRADPMEDPIKRKHREADLLKQQKLADYQQQAVGGRQESQHLQQAEQQLRDRMKLADESKKKTLQEFSDRGATHQESTHLEISERALKEKIKQADILKQKTLDAYDKAAGKTDGKTVTTTRKVETVTKVGGASGKPADEIAPQLAQQIIKAAGNVSGVLTVKTESWSSRDNVTRTSEKTESWGGRGRGGAMNAFKAMDAKNAPKTNLGAPGRANITRSPSAIKTMLLEWAKAMTREYIDTIEITNFSTSWNDGIAFCALIHHFYPDAFDFKSLNPKNRRQNFELAFDTAEKLADIAPLLDVEDMVRMQKPDWKCVFTYVQSFYRKLNAHEKNKSQ